MPNSFLWLGLVVLSLFVLVPMVVNLRQPIFKAGDRALSSRLLHRGGGRLRLGRQTLSGHGSSPDGGADSAHQHAQLNTIHGEDVMDSRAHNEGGFVADDGFGIPDDAELELETEQGSSRRGRGGFDPEADEIAAAARYTLRQRIVIGLGALVVLSAVVALLFTSYAWYVTAISIVAFAGYLVYLRTQVRIEQNIRERRLARLRGERRRENAAGGPDGSVVGTDDENPEFDHLDRFGDTAGPGRASSGLPRAAGQ
ncbi:divisome protein SepX/GlpR [Hoyosella subflava]|uniref:Transmembrane protein n=1 Tax=Hoyosella subflava (strain DSM 45089 / JCM 17490 / NBRC 109087 / DQS3-9A1) TaxID=443218 RepID=F6ERB4_HOYSD|nr:gephyrin-like molybdotransferase receptor GlpR [Hoyosella subflava]AEF41992.1 hypothetical protein AS9A_3554 [Hoyosella subflava DQS3-9A1]